MSLLNQLRHGKLVPVNHPYRTTRKRAQYLMNLIIEHKSEFPAKLRPAITAAATKCRPGIFVSEVYIAATYFFFGRYRPNNDDFHNVDGNDNHHEMMKPPWYGLDDEIDTIDEAEVVIRLFPWILQEELMGMPSSKGQIPIFFLASSSKAVSFVPLFAKLGAELGVFSKKESTGLTWSGNSGSALEQLFVNTFATTEFGREPTNESDKKSLDVLIRLRKMGFVSETSENKLILWLFTAAKHREIDFVEKRLQLLIDWRPTILMNNCQHTNLLQKFLNHFQNRSRCEPYALRLFEAIVELGMSRYPMELGFAFHRTDDSSTRSAALAIPEIHPNASCTNFSLACANFGTETVTRIVNKVLSKTMKQTYSPRKNGTNNLQTILLEASTNEKISLEGVYSLIRRDPVAVVLAP